MHKLRKLRSTLFKRKYLWYWIVGLIIFGTVAFFFFGNQAENTEVFSVQKGDLVQQVSVSGKLIATENLNLTFEQSGQVRGVYVKEGDEVRAGKLLATQDTAQLAAQLKEMEAGIDLQKAKLAQLLAGASAEDVKVYQDKVASAQQDVEDAYDNALITLDEAYAIIYNAHSKTLYMQNTYFAASDQSAIKVQSSRLKIQESLADAKAALDSTKGGASHTTITLALSRVLLDLGQVYNQLVVVRDACDEGIYYSSVSSTDKTAMDTQKTNLTTELSEVKAAQQTIQSKELALTQAESQLALTKAPARPSDIAVYKAQIAQAEASAQGVLAQLRKRQIYAPLDGIITKVDVKLGSIASPTEGSISLISRDPYVIESFVPEIYVSMVKVGDLATVTLDAYGAGVTFEAKVVSVDPAETIKDGVATYRTKLQFLANDTRIKTGMTANVVIVTDKRSGVLSVPEGAIFEKYGKRLVKVQVGKEVAEREITMGLVSSLGLVEVTSGLQEGDTVLISE